jgi:hypothetical protein
VSQARLASSWPLRFVGLRHLQDGSDAPGGAIGGKMSLKEIR